MRLTESEMISLWRSRLGLSAEGADPALSRSDDAQIDEQVKIDIDAWQDALLDNAPPDCLVATDITSDLAFAEREPGCLVAPLPDRVRRILMVKPADAPAARLVDPTADSETAVRQANPFARAGRLQPVAVSDGAELRVYAGSDATIERVTAVVTPPEGYYEFTPKALTTAFNPLTKKFDTI